MIATRFCDVCNTELPPSCFVNYECVDLALHALHPRHDWASIRITASPNYTNGDMSSRADLCPWCFLKMAQLLVAKIERRNRRETAMLEAWQKQRGVSRTQDEVRTGANEQAKRKRAKK